MKEKLHAGKGEGEARVGETGEHTSRQAAGLFWSTSGVSGRDTQNGIRDLTQSFLSSVLEQ